ncbi:MAG: PEGA domain-containing protein [Deltaproteobacteria bacterium]|nr:PEGA domain-containing protein [Deltaproteobacteria bacterium]
MTALRASLVLLCLVVFAARSWGAEKPSRPLGQALAGEARDLYEVGRVLFTSRDYLTSVTKFERAYELSRDPRLLWNMASCRAKLKQYARALTLLDQYVSTAGALLTEAEQAEAARSRAGLAARVATVEVVSQPEGVQVFVDDSLAGTTPLERPLFMDAGARKVRFERPGFRPQSCVEHLSGGSASSWRITLERIRVELVDGPVAGEPPATPSTSR